MPTPLEGIKVIDLSRALAGPYCTMILGDMGADVIKIEPPTGDETRAWGPPFMPHTQDSAYYCALNRNKKSIILDLKMEEGKKIFSKLLETADVIVQNFRVGTMEKLGFGYDKIQTSHPKIIYCSISGFGSTGPYAQRGGYDVIVQGMGGLMSITGEPDGMPMRVGVPIVDITTGMFAVQGILAGLFAREKTGLGQLVETSLFESQLAWLTNVGSNYLISKKIPQRIGNQHPNITPYQPYQASDGYVIVAVGNEKLWYSFTQAIGRKDLTQDTRFCNNVVRNEHRRELNEILNTIFITKTSKEWTEIFTALDIPAGPIYTLDKVFSDPQVEAREMLVTIQHPQAGPIQMTGLPIKFSQTPGKIEKHPPMLGEHTTQVLLESGYTQEEIIEFQQKKII